MAVDEALPGRVEPVHIELHRVNLLVKMIGIFQIQPHHLPDPIGMLNIGERKGLITIFAIGHQGGQLGAAARPLLEVGQNFILELGNLRAQFRGEDPLRGLDAQLPIFGAQRNVALF